MKKELKVMLLNPPSPSHMDVCRDWAGGFGTAIPNNRKGYGQSGDPFFYPFLAYASSILHQRNCEFSILDGQKSKLNQQGTLQIVEKKNPNLIISQIGLPSLRGDLTLLNAIKDALPSTTLVCVGTSCHVLQQEILGKSKVDLLSTSRYPYVANLNQLIDALEQGTELDNIPCVSFLKGGQIFASTGGCTKSLVGLPFPRYEELDLNGYERFKDTDGIRYSYIPIVGAIGCASMCYYCPYPIGFGNQWEGRSSEDIVGEIEYLSSRNVEGFMFRDQSFPIFEKRAAKICDMIIERKIELPWFCEARLDNLNRAILEKMKKAGCKSIQLGVETGDESLISVAKPKSNLDITRKAFNLTKEFKISSVGHIVFGWPSETIESMRKTACFVEELAPDRVHWSYLTPYPGTSLSRIAQEQKLIVSNDWSNYTSETVVMRSKWLSAYQISTMGKQIMRNYWKVETFRQISQFGKKPLPVSRELSNKLMYLLKNVRVGSNEETLDVEPL
ncbi:MAG: B12-binding domain-containing radical SAM protein [Candidatus Bathyarchaeia archaeon]